MIHLARLDLPAKEVERFSRKAENVLHYIEQLRELDTEKVEPTSHAIEVVNAFREDKVRPFKDVSEILKIAPAQLDDLYEVPKVIDENS